MAIKNQVLDMSAIGMRFTVLQSSTDTDGRSLDLHWEILPKCNMTDALFHTHPHAIETYEILEGEMEFFIKNKWFPAKKGDKIIVEKGITHCFRNPTDKIVSVFNTHQPALKMEYYFEDACSILTKLTLNKSAPFKMNMRARLYMSVLMNNYRNDIVAKRPPDFAIKILGYLGKLLKINY
jgi:mannose-6-phosphate isomerase-like protein (cupin superfamily)